MGQAAKALDLPRVRVEGYSRAPDAKERVRGKGRAIAVAKFRELADLLEQGVLDGARVGWLDTHGLLVEVERDGERKQLELKDDEETPSGAQAISGLEFVTRTAWTEDGSGTVEYRAVTVEEEDG